MKMATVFFAFVVVLLFIAAPAHASSRVVPLYAISDATGYNLDQVEKILNLSPKQIKMLLKEKFWISVSESWESGNSQIIFGKKGYISVTICNQRKCTKFFFGDKDI